MIWPNLNRALLRKSNVSGSSHSGVTGTRDLRLDWPGESACFGRPGALDFALENAFLLELVGLFLEVHLEGTHGLNDAETEFTDGVNLTGSVPPRLRVPESLTRYERFQESAELGQAHFESNLGFSS